MKSIISAIVAILQCAIIVWMSSMMKDQQRRLEKYRTQNIEIINLANMCASALEDQLNHAGLCKR